MSEKGPIYGVELIDVLPVGSGSMRQAMPSRMDLNRVLKVNERTVAGYEVLLASWRELLEAGKLMWAFYNDLDTSNPGFMGKLVLQDYAQWNEAMLAMPAAIAKAEATP